MNDIIPPRQLPKPPVRPTPMTGPQPLPVPRASFEDKAGLQFKKPVKRSKLKWVLVAAGILIVLLTAGAVGAYVWYKDSMKPFSNSDQRIKVEVSSGESSDQVVNDLQQKGVVKNALALQIYMRLHNKGSVKAGSYLFAPNQQPEEIVQWLIDGRVDTFKVTIVPGQTLAQIKKALMSYGFSPGDIDSAFNATYDSKLFTDKPSGTNLEGYIYPDTYFVTSNSPVKDVLSRSFDEFEQRIEQNNLRAALAQQNLTLYQGITLASIVEREVSNAADQRQIAQVFEKRLQEGMMLGSDVTYHYAASLLGVAPSPDIRSPYNTRLNAGLPPGPIANFDIGALHAVAQPAPGSYLYFVAGDDGTVHYATTLEQHNLNIQQFCKKLCASN